MSTTPRQRAWADAAERSEEPARTFFGLLAQPNAREREHNCREHAVGFRRNGRRGFKCGIDNTVIRWVDPA